MLLEFIDLNFPLVAAVICDNQKVIVNEKWHRMRLEKSTKNDNRIQEENNDKKAIKFEINKKSNVSTYCGKNWKVITIMKIVVYLKAHSKI